MHNSKGCWVQCAVAALALFCTLGLNINTFSVYLPYLTQLLELTPTQSSSFLMVRGLASAGAVYLAKYYYDKLEIRRGYALALLMSVSALFLYAYASNYMSLCIAAAISGTSCGLGSMYPVAILIHRWFPKHEGLAMGICASSSGLAITIGAPILTYLIETRSLLIAIYSEAGFILFCVVICFLFLRNYPAQQLHFTHKAKNIRHPFRINSMFLAIVALGIMGEAISFLTVHYNIENFNPYGISAIVSVVGAFLIGAKFLLGELFDVWGGYRTNWVFFSSSILGCLLFSLGSIAGYIPAFLAAGLYGLGLSVQTVGVTVYAKDLSNPENFAATQQQYQFASLIGAPICTLISGLVASSTGNYRCFYLVIAGIMVFATIVIQKAYKRRNKQ